MPPNSHIGKEKEKEKIMGKRNKVHKKEHKKDEAQEIVIDSFGKKMELFVPSM
jgi:hypothetical protein